MSTASLSYVFNSAAGAQLIASTVGDRLNKMAETKPNEVCYTRILAAAQICVIKVLMNPAYQQVEIEFMLAKTRAKGIVMLENLKSLRDNSIFYSRFAPNLKVPARAS